MPTRWITAQEVRESVALPDAWSWVYSRRFSDGEYIGGQFQSRESLALEWSATLEDKPVDYLVQPLLRPEVGFAACVTPEAWYIEAVAGHPLRLLRFGLRDAWATSEGQHGGVALSAVARRFGSSLAPDQSWLVEGGMVHDSFVIFEAWHLAPSTAQRCIDDGAFPRLRPRGSSGTRPVFLPLPSLSFVPIAARAGLVLVGGGARLAHFCTSSDRDFDIRFLHKSAPA